MISREKWSPYRPLLCGRSTSSNDEARPHFEASRIESPGTSAHVSRRGRGELPRKQRGAWNRPVEGAPPMLASGWGNLNRRPTNASRLPHPRMSGSGGTQSQRMRSVPTAISSNQASVPAISAPKRTASIGGAGSKSPPRSKEPSTVRSGTAVSSSHT